MAPLKVHIEPWSLISSLDRVVFCVILGLTIASVVYGHRKKKFAGKEEASFLDLLVMGRNLTLPLFIATLVATWYGGIFGVTKIAFEKGIYNFITQGLFWYGAYIIFAFFIVGKIDVYRALTLPDLIGKMFGPRSAKLSAWFNLFNVLPIVYVISLGLFLQLLFGGDLWVMISLGVVGTLFYSLWGGLRAVVFSDLIQFLPMCLGVFLVLVFSLSTYGGWGFLKENLPLEYFSLTGGMGWGITLAWGLIALSTLVDPNFYQRCFAASSPKIAKRGILISTLIWFLFDICTTLGAMYARAVIPQAESKKAYLIYALQILPEGFRGLMLAGILATILSTLDSYLFLAGTTLSFDLGPKRWKRKKVFHCLGMIVCGILAVGLAVVFEGNIRDVWKTLGSYFASCLLLPVVYGYLFPKKIQDNQFVSACLLGVIAVTLWKNRENPSFLVGLDELYVGMTATGLGLFFYPLVAKAKNIKLI